MPVRGAWAAIASAAAVALGACAGGGSAGARTDYGDLGGASVLTTVEPTPGVLERESWSFGSAEGEVIRTAHYRLFTTESDLALRERMPRFLEHALAGYRTFAGVLPPPPQKLDTYLMDNRPQWETLTKRLMGAQAGDIGNIQRGGFASRGVGVYYDLGQFDTLAIAGHEGWHQYTQRTFRDPLPAWLEEGIATHFEGYGWIGGGMGKPEFRAWSNLERFDRLRAIVAEGRLRTLEQVVASSPQDYLASDSGTGLLDFYAHVWIVVHFLREHDGGAQLGALTRLLGEAARGVVRERLAEELGASEAMRALGSRKGEAVFRVYFGKPAELEAKFQAFAREAVRPGGRERIVAGRSPVGSE